MKYKKYLVYFAEGISRGDGTVLSSDISHAIAAFNIKGACFKASELEGDFEQMSEYVEDDKGNKYTFEIDVIITKVK